MTIPEVNRAIQAWGWREKRKNTFICSALYKLPTLIAIAVWNGKEYPEIFDTFPEYFDKEEILEQRKKQQIQKDMDVFKAWAAQFNERQKERDQ